MTHPPYFGHDVKNLPAAPIVYFTETEFAGWIGAAFVLGTVFALFVLTALSMGAA